MWSTEAYRMSIKYMSKHYVHLFHIYSKRYPVLLWNYLRDFLITINPIFVAPYGLPNQASFLLI